MYHLIMQKTGVIINDISDHLSIFTDINHKGWCYTENVKKFKTISKFTDENMHVLNDYIIRFDLRTIISSTDVDECYNLLI